MLNDQMRVAVICAGALGLLLFCLSMAISLMRLHTGVLTGSNSDPANLLNKLVRAQGNTAEYAPLLAAFMLYLGTRATPSWVVFSMIGATVSRYLFAAGLLMAPTMAKPHPVRFVGALGTYVAGVALSIAVLMQF